MPQATEREKTPYSESVNRFARKKQGDYESFRNREKSVQWRREDEFNEKPRSHEDSYNHHKMVENDYYRGVNAAFNAKERDIRDAQSGRSTPSEVMSSLYGQRYGDISLPKDKKPSFGRKKKS